MNTQLYKYSDQDFIVTKPETCSMQVSLGDFKAEINIHAATNRYRESLDGWGNDHDSLKQALDSACQRILDKAAQPTKKELCSGMDEFFDELGKGN